MGREAALKVLQEHKQELKERYGFTRLGIFGSVARDEAAGESDVDVVAPMAPDLFGRVSLKDELETILGAKVDLVRYWQRMNHYLKRHASIGRHAMYDGGLAKIESGDAHPEQPGGEIILCQIEDGRTRIQVRMDGETVWLTIAQMVELFQVDKSGISRHLDNVHDTRGSVP